MRIASVGIMLAILVASGGCDPTPLDPAPALPDVEPERGKSAVVEYGCGSCHSIPGIRQANSYVAPPLLNWARRSFIAGEVPNNGENLARWIEDPQEVRPGTAMPDLGVTPADARAIAAYLLTLE